MGRFEALQDLLSQSVEAVQRNSRIDIVSGGVDEIDPPEDLDEFADQARSVGIVRANMRKWVNDVWEPGYRLEGPDETIEFFEEDTESTADVTFTEESDEPQGYLENAFVFAGERNEDFLSGAKETTHQRWVRGTVLLELLKDDPNANPDEWRPTGFYFIRPETVNVQVENNSDILLPPNPDDLPEDIDSQDVQTTPRGEVASYIQFDDESIIGLRRNGYDEQEVPLSQNDVLKQTLEPGIGGDVADVNNRTVTEASSVFGNSVIKAVSQEISEYQQIKRDRAEAISRKAYGIWTAQFTPETLDLGDRIEITEWNDESITQTENELQSMGPGDVLTSNANIDLQKHESSVPELEGTLMHLVDDILAALPVPKALTGFADNINRDVVSDQREAYQDLISEERNFQAQFWSMALREVADRYGLPTDGLELKIQPAKEDNPVKSLDTEEIDRMNTYINTLSVAAGPQAGPTALVDSQELLEVLDFPQEMENPEDVVEEVSTEETEAAWRDIMGLESLARYSEGDIVDTPDGIGIISGISTEPFNGPNGEIEATEDSPTYTVAVEDEDKMVGFYSASDLSPGELPDTEVDNPAESLSHNPTDIETEALLETTFDIPETWEESPKPNRLILLDAWSSMGGTFTGARQELGSARLAASMKDRVLQWEGWRNGG